LQLPPPNSMPSRPHTPLSRTCAQHLADFGFIRARRADRECVDIETQSEDYHLGVCLALAGITTTPLDSRDSQGGEYFQVKRPIHPPLTLTRPQHTHAAFRIHRWHA
jgi:hypothetical protein